MKKATFTFQCRLTAPASFSAYKGSMLRGSLGVFLKKTCCTVRQRNCEDCILSQHCAFPALFTGKPAKDGKQAVALPPPYCMEPGDTGKTSYEAGERFSFNLTLFSYAVSYLPYFVHAFILSGQSGMGKHSEERRGTFELEEIFYEGRSIFCKETQKIMIPAGEELALPTWNPSPAKEGTLLVHLKTPCRFKADNRLCAELSFRQMFNLVVRRIRSLWMLDGASVRFDDFSAMLDRADGVKTLETCLFWKDWTRYSSRQKSSMQLGGLQGSVRYHGDLSAFLPFFILAEKLHIGKQTSFGLGQITVQWTPDETNSHSCIRQDAADHH